jgi:type IV secretory pathway VirB10-like protein
LLGPQDSGPARPRSVLAAVAVLSLLLLGAFGAMSLLRRDARESYQPAGRDESPVAAVASPESPTVAPTSPAEGSPTLTPEPPTSTPSATASPTPDPPTATPPPPTPTPADTRQTEAQLDAQSGAGRVLQWYDLVVADRFDDAYALWSDRMRANFPREANLDGRWANTVSISVNDLRVLSASGDQMIVAIDFVETLANGSSRRFVGSWQLVASDSGWLLDSPSF